MKTVTTTKELLDLRNSAGVIEIDGDLRIECDVPWPDVGEHIAGVEVTGYLSVREHLDVGGYLDVGGCLYVRGYLSVREHLDVGGYLDVGGCLYVRGNLSVREHLDVGGYLSVRGNLSVRGHLDVGGYLVCMGNLDCGGEYLIILGDLKWQFASMPTIPERSYVRRVVPHEHQRAHWQERLGIDLSEGCYDALCSKVLKRIVRLLNDEKWSSTERWMLETLRDSEKPAPDWVNEIKEQK